MSQRQKVVVIGIDGATFDLIRPWVDEGKLPTFQRLMQKGAHGILESTFPAVTVPAWPAMLTGKSPAQLGIVHFTERASDSYVIKPVQLQWERWNPIWSVLGRAGRRVCMINVPATRVPANGVNGVLVAGPIFHTQGDRLAWPPEVDSWLQGIGYSPNEPTLDARGEEWFLKSAREVTRTKVEVALELMQREDWDFFMFVFFHVDQVMHYFWRYMDSQHPRYQETTWSNAIENAYREIDDYLAVLLEHIPTGASLFLVSDHGHGALFKAVDVNAWLHSKVFLALRKDVPIRSVNARSSFRRGLRGSHLLHRGYTAVKRCPLLMKWLRTVWSVFDGSSSLSGAVDWPQTRAYALGFNGIFVNLEGREPAGRVLRSEYEEVRSEIISDLEQLMDEELDLAVVSKAWRIEEIYRITAPPDRLPDIMIEFTGDSWYLNYNHNMRGIGEEAFLVHPYSSSHTPRGMLLAYGRDIRSGFQIDGAGITDVMPTILHMMGIPIPRDVEGNVMRELFREGSDILEREIRYQQASHESSSVGEISDGDQQEVLERLRGLGYLE